MTPRLRARRCAGLGALGLFLLQVYVFWATLPATIPCHPQIWAHFYNTEMLWNFWLALKTEGGFQEYRASILFLDTAFIALFCLWAALNLPWPPRGRALIGLGLVALYAATDLAENVLILRPYETLNLPALVFYLPVEADRDMASYFTTAKFVAFLAVCAAVFAVRRRNGERG